MKNSLYKIFLVLVIFSIVLSAVGCQRINETGTTPEETSLEVTTPQKTTPTQTTPSSTTNSDVAGENPPKEEVDLSQINKLREDYQHGTCKNLRDTVSVILFYMDDFESSWTNEEMDRFTEDEIEPGLRFLEAEAQKYGVTLNLQIQEVYRSVPYDDEVITSTKETGLVTIDVLLQASCHVGYYNTALMIKAFRSIYKTDEVICLTIFNKKGAGYAINPKKDVLTPIDEHCILFVRDRNSTGNEPVGSQASIVAHEILYLYGAENFYSSTSREQLAEKYYKNDIMLNMSYYVNSNTIGDATAFYIGWQDEVPDILYDDRWS